MSLLIHLHNISVPISQNKTDKRIMKTWQQSWIHNIIQHYIADWSIHYGKNKSQHCIWCSFPHYGGLIPIYSIRESFDLIWENSLGSIVGKDSVKWFCFSPAGFLHFPEATIMAMGLKSDAGVKEHLNLAWVSESAKAMILRNSKNYHRCPKCL